MPFRSFRWRGASTFAPHCLTDWSNVTGQDRQRSSRRPWPLENLPVKGAGALSRRRGVHVNGTAEMIAAHNASVAEWRRRRRSGGPRQSVEAIDGAPVVDIRPVWR
jgi:hypothetical protein